MVSEPQSGVLAALTCVRDVRSARASSWDSSGRNQDYWIMPPGESIVLADPEGPGCITHIWMTQFCRRVPGPDLVDPVQVGQTVPVLEIHNALGLNWEAPDPNYYRMVLLKIYWDDQEHPSVSAPLGDFFCIGHSMPGNFASTPFTLSSKEQERHTFSGTAALNCYLQMPFKRRARIELENQNDVPYGQYFYIDYELYREPPSLHGTGAEDYFGHAWGMQSNAYPMNGSIVHESVMPGYPVSYRFHLVDPVRFQRRIRVTIEHEHANQLSDDWASTAYWYQTLPSRPFSILPVQQRLPIRPPRPSGSAPARGIKLNDEMRAMRAVQQEWYARYVEERNAVLEGASTTQGDART